MSTKPTEPVGPVDQRGFRIFGDEGGVMVKESSLAFEGAHVRIYGGRHDDGHVQLSVAQARKVKHWLDLFLIEAELGWLTEPATREPAKE